MTINKCIYFGGDWDHHLDPGFIIAFISNIKGLEVGLPSLIAFVIILYCHTYITELYSNWQNCLSSVPGMGTYKVTHTVMALMAVSSKYNRAKVVGMSL